MKRKLISAVLAMSIILSFINISIIRVSATTDISIGDYIQMGTYYGEPILWRCVDVDENGPLILSDKIICVKPFDANGTNIKGSHGRGYNSGDSRKRNGSNYWGDSNIRSWLNSNAIAGEVEWLCGNPPTPDSVAYDSYSEKSGFLTCFTIAERNMIQNTFQKKSFEWL